MPVLLFGRDVLGADRSTGTALAEAGTISPEDLDLFRFVETAEEAVDIIDGWKNWSKRSVVPGR